VKGATEPPSTSKETAMTTLTSLIRPAAAPSFQVASPVSALRGLVVFCLSAVIAAGFVLDLAGGRTGEAPAQPRNQLVQQASSLT
jgi:hypothetical protein